MKTAISIPDDVFEQATRRAQELHISRSEFISVAVRRYLDTLNAESITSQINEVVDALGTDASNDLAVDAGRRTLLSSGGDW